MRHPGLAKLADRLGDQPVVERSCWVRRIWIISRPALSHGPLGAEQLVN